MPRGHTKTNRPKQQERISKAIALLSVVSYDSLQYPNTTELRDAIYRTQELLQNLHAKLKFLSNG
jgi:hypothetical protein